MAWKSTITSLLALASLSVGAAAANNHDLPRQTMQAADGHHIWQREAIDQSLLLRAVNNGTNSTEPGAPGVGNCPDWPLWCSDAECGGDVSSKKT